MCMDSARYRFLELLLRVFDFEEILNNPGFETRIFHILNMDFNLVRGSIPCPRAM